jgi:hypothetical protein
MRFRVGQIVRIEFLDHAENCPEPVPIICYGEIGEVNKKYIRVDAWRWAGERNPANETRYIILRGAITRVSFLKEARDGKKR